MTRRLRRSSLALALAGSAACAANPGPDGSPDPEPAAAPAAAPLVQPGAPGEASRAFDADELASLGGVRWTEADVRFMQGMIPHHAQALEMTALVTGRARSEGVKQMALRMEISQRDEIALMARWLRERNQDVPDWRAPMDHAGHGMDHPGMPRGMGLMPGMLTPDQMARLRGATGTEFDRLFLEYMIQHHGGARVMVRDLFATRGAGQESEIFQFASHVDADQTAEIQRMQGLLESLR